MKLLIAVIAFELFLIFGVVLHKKYFTKKIQPEIPASEIKQIQKDIRGVVAERKRVEFKRIK